ncbi:hypothetical protein LX36DRAFT_693078, partial [Colletotrichum falcatum]
MESWKSLGRGTSSRLATLTDDMPCWAGYIDHVRTWASCLPQRERGGGHTAF